MQSTVEDRDLGKIWDLADIDCDGQLDLPEFILAMHLTESCTKGAPIPPSLPSNLIPPEKVGIRPPNSSASKLSPFEVRRASVNAILSKTLTQQLQSSQLALSPSSVVQSPTIVQSPNEMQLALPSTFNNNHHQSDQHPGIFTNYPDWAISGEEFDKAYKIFAGLDTDADGLVSGQQCHDALTSSGLPRMMLAQIWELVDVNGLGKLNIEQWAVVMRLITEQLSLGQFERGLPPTLPLALVPPCLRPLPIDPSHLEEGRRLGVEIDELGREVIKVEEYSKQLLEQARLDAVASSSIQPRIESMVATKSALSNQQVEAERRLTDYASEQDSAEKLLANLTAALDESKGQLEQMRAQADSQQVSVKSQEEMTGKLRGELNDLTQEEARLNERLVELKSQLVTLESANQTSLNQFSKIESEMGLMERDKELLKQAASSLNTGAGDNVTNVDQIQQLIATYTNKPTRVPFSSAVATVNAFSSLSTASTTTTMAGNLGEGWNAFSQKPFSPTTTSSSAWDAFPTSKSNGHTDASSNSAFAANSFDPFGAPSLTGSSGHDPFDDKDLFGQDPFASSSSKAIASQPLDSLDRGFAAQGRNFSSSDPFAPNSTTSPSSAFSPSSSFASNTVTTNNQSSTWTGIDFDAFGGNSNTTARKQPTDDPFGLDPFSPPPSTNHRQHRLSDAPSLSPPAAALASKSTYKTTPPPRPTAQPRTKPGRNTAFSRTMRQSSRHSSTDQSPTTFIPPGMSESEQLSIATRESRRLAQFEADARAKEEADIKKAIQLSKMDA